MVRVDLTQLSCHGTWIDGYLPGIKEMKRLARLYRDLDVGEQGLPQMYGFSQATDGWLQEDYFGSIASALRARYHHENLSPDVRTAPCCMWLIKIDKEPSHPRIKPIYEEYKVDPRKENYYHLISIHDECPVEEDCLQQVMQDLHFESKLESDYIDQERFMGAVRKVLQQYVGIMAAPWLDVETHLDAISEGVASAVLEEDELGKN